MTFVKEKIPEEYKKKHSIELTDEWCIDRERDAIFYHTGGNPRGPETSFLFIWKGNGLEVGSIWRSTNNSNEIEWCDTYVPIPAHLEAQRQEILRAIIDAFACGNYLGKKVIFDSRMNFNENKGIGRCQ